MFPEDVLEQARDVLARFSAAGCKVATAESCTGGLIAGALTEIAGSSSVVERGCETTFELAGGRVASWSLRGNACV